MTEQFKDDAPEHPALAGFNSGWEKFKHVVKRTAMIALKGAVIGGLVIGTLAAAPALVAAVTSIIPGAGSLLSWVGYGAQDWLIGGAVAGLKIGAVAGAAIGLAKGFGEADDAVEDQEQALITKFNRSKQLAAQQEMMAMNMQRMQASQMQLGGMGMQPTYAANTPNMGQNMGQGRPV